jgi:hypothetical protein
MRVLGVDPGSVHFAWAVVEVSGRGEVLAHGQCDPAGLRAELCGALDEWPVARAAVEVPRLCGSASQPLIETAIVAGRCLEYLEGSHIRRWRPACPPVRCTSWEWRAHVVGVSGAKDREVKAALTALLPVLPRCSTHVRDAIGVALWAGGQP